MNRPKGAGCALIILAAGASARLGRPKQLLPFRGRSLLRHAAETALNSVCRPVVVVLGAFADELQSELAALPVTVAINPAWADGMASSIRTGLREVASGPDAVVIMLCDQPLVTAGMLDRLVSVHRGEERGIVASAYEGTSGVPALFSRKYYRELGLLEGDQGAKKIIVKHENDLARISLPEAAFDVDRLEDAARLERNGGG
ncbi:MAG: NTP transferase domain-containing protein [Limisphaerales bacterium]